MVCIVSLRGSNVISVGSGLTAQPCLGAGQVEQGRHQHFGLCEFSGRPAGDSPGSSTHPAHVQHKKINFMFIYWSKILMNLGSMLTLCCSRALCTVSAVISWACWTTISCRRAPSASCSHAPTVARGAGRDRSSWRCQSTSWNMTVSFNRCACDEYNLLVIIQQKKAHLNISEIVGFINMC